jgi:hypothetical protein
VNQALEVLDNLLAARHSLASFFNIEDGGNTFL